ncbi:MAG: protein-tyrosine phosphatase family protein, partial [Desulfohalobiaceae bacterium]
MTSSLAVGHAPMSYQHLDLLKQAGINAILNLCAEFPDLPLIEQQAGFEVYYMPVQDEETPEMEAMDNALEWLDEAI